jgi:CRISPR-associated protein Cas1
MNAILIPDTWSWWRVRVRVRNRRNKAAREHPLFILRALVYSARSSLPEDLAPEKESFRVRVCQSTGTRVRKGAIYEFDMLFRPEQEAQANAMAQALRVWLADPEHHFECLSVSVPELRNLAILREEKPLDGAVRELCLDFHTPLAFNPKDSSRTWQLDVDQLRLMLDRRARAVFGEDVPKTPVVDVQLLCHFLHGYQSHQHRKDAKVAEWLHGVEGPLFLRGDWQAWEPWIRLCSEWLVGSGTSKSQGAFRPCIGRAVIDPLLLYKEDYRSAWEVYVAETDHDESFSHVMNDAGHLAEEIAEEIKELRWQPAPARVFAIPKASGGSRSISLLDPRDALVHRVLHGALAPALDRLMDHASHGFRPGRSFASARKEVLAALRDGADYVVESDLADFFDTIDWQLLQDTIDSVLPDGDHRTRQLLSRIMRTPLAQSSDGERTRGLLQGSPLSPLLANVFLLPFDQALRREGLHLVRYADDFVILSKGREEAERALTIAKAQAQALGLLLKESKTAIRPASLGFRFLGEELGGDFEEAVIERTALRRAVFFRPPYGFVGIDHQAVVLRRDHHVVAHIPIERIGHLLFHGTFSISTVLLSVCASRGIPVTLCSAAGHHRHTFAPLSRVFHERMARHSSVHRQMSEKGLLAVAASTVAAKLQHYISWFSSMPSDAARSAAREIRSELQRLPACDSVESLRGREGIAARTAFRTVNDLLIVDDFRSTHRIPHEKPDRWNALLDFGYSQLFSHLNALVRGEGLNPYLGFLHSPGDRFESLVADLEEPFRARVDRWAVRAVNLGTAKADDFVLADDGTRWGICHEAYPKLLESFARELDRKILPDPGALHELLHAQVLVLRAWVDQADDLRFWSPPCENP